MTEKEFVSAETGKEIISTHHERGEEVLVNIGAPYGTVRVDAIDLNTFAVMDGDRLYMEYGGCHYHEVYHVWAKGKVYIIISKA